jgi:hypothetical protein
MDNYIVKSIHNYIKISSSPNSSSYVCLNCGDNYKEELPVRQIRKETLCTKRTTI